mmetsp:Transcript_8880/g.21225  ORF Transcript_8880/g.21225 Transcript_8880/m.21225 type:complete len:243 (-) Transcript_8880:712-1440(-)
MDPAAERRNELCGLDGPRTIHVDHLEELRQVHLVNIHDSKSALKLRVFASTFYQLFQRELAAPIFVDSFEDFLEELLIIFMISFHLLCQIKNIPFTSFSKGVDHNGHDQIQDAKNQSQEGSDKDNSSRWIFQDHGHRYLPPAVTSNNCLEKQQVRVHHSAGCIQALSTVVENTRFEVQFLDSRMDHLNHKHGPDSHDHEAKEERPKQGLEARGHHGHQFLQFPETPDLPKEPDQADDPGESK